MLVRALFGVALISALPASGFELRQDKDGDVVRWKRPVVLTVDPNLGRDLRAPGARAALEAAVNALRKATPGLEITLVEGEPGELGYDTVNPGTNRNSVVALKEWPWAKTNLAATVLTINARTNEILDADIAFNLEEYEFDVLDRGQPSTRSPELANDVQNTFTHELGHAVGLMHSTVEDVAVMYPSAPPGETQKRQFAVDDQQGLHALYVEVVSLEPVDTEPPMGCSAAGGGPFGLLALLAGLLSRRRAGALALAGLFPMAAWAADVDGPLKDQVSLGEVVEVKSTRLPGPVTLIVSDVQVRVVGCGGTCMETTVIRVVGGRVGDLEQVVVHNPVPTKGQLVLLGWQKGRRMLKVLDQPPSATASPPAVRVRPAAGQTAAR